MRLNRRLYLIIGPLVLSLLPTMTSACSNDATPIRVLSAGPLEDGLITLAAAYKAETGHEVMIETGTTPVVREHLEAGEVFDVVIATQTVLDAAAARGQVEPSTALVVGKVGIGVAIRDDIEVPEVRSADELKAFLLSADTVAYNEGSSGVYSRSMIASMGITDEIAARTTRYANGTQVLAHVREGKGRNLGLAPLTEIQANAPEGIRIIPLPDDIQNYTVYHAVVATGAVEAGGDFVRFLTTPKARATFASTGVD